MSGGFSVLQQHSWNARLTSNTSSPRFSPSVSDNPWSRPISSHFAPAQMRWRPGSAKMTLSVPSALTSTASPSSCSAATMSAKFACTSSGRLKVAGNVPSAAPSPSQRGLPSTWPWRSQPRSTRDNGQVGTKASAFYMSASWRSSARTMKSPSVWCAKAPNGIKFTSVFRWRRPLSRKRWMKAKMERITANSSVRAKINGIPA